MKARKLLTQLGLTVLVSLLVSSVTQATVIMSPVAAPVNTLGEFGACCDIGNSIDGSGLAPGFISGVTDFDAYLALNPLHSFAFLNNEFFGEDSSAARLFTTWAALYSSTAWPSGTKTAPASRR